METCLQIVSGRQEAVRIQVSKSVFQLRIIPLAISSSWNCIPVLLIKSLSLLSYILLSFIPPLTARDLSFHHSMATDFFKVSADLTDPCNAVCLLFFFLRELILVYLLFCLSPLTIPSLSYLCLPSWVPSYLFECSIAFPSSAYSNRLCPPRYSQSDYHLPVASSTLMDETATFYRWFSKWCLQKTGGDFCGLVGIFYILIVMVVTYLYILFNSRCKISEFLTVN